MGYHTYLSSIGIFILFVGCFLLILGVSTEKRLRFSDTTLQSKFALAAVFLIPTGTIWLTIEFVVWRYRRGYCCEEDSNDGDASTGLVNQQPSGQPGPRYYTNSRGEIILLYRNNGKLHYLLRYKSLLSY